MGKFKPTIRNTIGRHARRAADIIEERGWTRGQLEDRDGRVCALGAFNRATSPMSLAEGITLRTAFSLHFGQWMQEHYPDQQLPSRLGLTWAPSWNDKVFSSKEEVVSWLRKFADDLDPQR